MLADNTIYEMEDIDEDWKNNEGKSWKSGSVVDVPQGVEFLNNGKVKMNGQKPKINNGVANDGNGNNGNNGQGNKKDKTALFGRHLKARTEEQQRNVDLLHRHLYSTTQGNKKVVAVRVSATDATYSNTEDHLRSKVFGKNANGSSSGDVFNLSSGYEQCSYGKLTFSPKETSTHGSITINNGVVTINVAIAATGVADGTVRNAVTSKIEQLLGSTSMTDVADYWMYCLPPGTSGSKFYTLFNVYLFYLSKLTRCIAWIFLAYLGWIAYAYINHWNSVYNNEWW